MWNEERPLELMDKELESSISVDEVVRCIHVALLCVQQRMEDRPTMSSVVFMLSNESAVPQSPREPGFCIASFSVKIESSSTGQTSSSANDVTITELTGR